MSADKQNPTPGSGANPDSRRWERHSATIPVDVTVFVSGDRANYRGEASDISRGGMLLFLPRELAPGTSLILEFLIPYQALKFINATSHQEEMIERTCQVLKLLR
jgi:c-di-GMP-binding flagellar brake protein YcgR